MSSYVLERRDALRASAVGIVGSVGGCIESLFESSRSMEPPPFGPPETDWPVTGFDAANSGCSPQATGPAREPTVEWEVQPSKEQNETPQIAVDGTLLVVVGDASIYAYGLDAGERRWSADVNGAGPVAIGESNCVVRTKPMQLRAFDRRDGTVRWTVNSDGQIAAPVFSNGRVFVPDDTGLLRVINAASGDTLWSVSFEEPVRKRVATDGNYVAVAIRDEIVVLNVEDGSAIWQESLPCCTWAGPLLLDGVLYTLRDDLRAWKVESGDLLWEYTPEVPGNSSGPTIHKEQVYLGRHTLSAINNSNGQRLWESSSDIRRVSSRPLCDGDTVYFTNGGYRVKNLAAVDARDGTVLWDMDIGSSISTLAVAGEHLLAGGTDGKLYSFREN